LLTAANNIRCPTIGHSRFCLSKRQKIFAI
jgi:hypothetical protein